MATPSPTITSKGHVYADAGDLSRHLICLSAHVELTRTFNVNFEGIHTILRETISANLVAEWLLNVPDNSSVGTLTLGMAEMLNRGERDVPLAEPTVQYASPVTTKTKTAASSYHRKAVVPLLVDVQPHTVFAPGEYDGIASYSGFLFGPTSPIDRLATMTLLPKDREKYAKTLGNLIEQRGTMQEAMINAANEVQIESRIEDPLREAALARLAGEAGSPVAIHQDQIEGLRNRLIIIEERIANCVMRYGSARFRWTLPFLASNEAAQKTLCDLYTATGIDGVSMDMIWLDLERALQQSVDIAFPAGLRKLL